jgi:uncharacterized protein
VTEPKISREDQPTRGRYLATIEGVDAQAELTFSRSSDKLIIADHTAVPEAFRGRGIGRLLVTRMIEDARKENFKIFALCPYVNAERKKHPEWADVFQN